VNKNIQQARLHLIEVTKGEKPFGNLHQAVVHLVEALEDQEAKVKNIIFDQVLEISQEADKITASKDDNVPSWVREYAERNRIRCGAILALLS